MKRSDIILNLQVEDNRFDFSACVNSNLSQAEIEIPSINETIDSISNLDTDCDRLDYILAASSGVLCGIFDIFLVDTPRNSSLGGATDNWFAKRVIDFATLCHPENKKFGSLNEAIRYLENKFAVPYDQTGIGFSGKEVFDLNPKNHHFKSLSHNLSFMGLFFSILDQFENESHFVTDGQLISLQKAGEKWELKGENVPAKLFCGFVNWIGHIMSDISGSRSSAAKSTRGMGIPPAFLTWINDITVIKAEMKLPSTDIDKAINELAKKIFEQGYDVRFRVTQAIPVFVNEIITRFIYSLRRLLNYFSNTPRSDQSFNRLWKKCEPFSNLTVKRMLFVAHGAFCLVDIGGALSATLLKSGTLDLYEFLLHLNIIGVGRFTISLIGQIKINFSQELKNEVNYALSEKIIVENYIEGLKILQKAYDDARFLTFVEDFKKSDAYIEAFEKSVKLAKLRNVPPEKILKNKSEIDKFFKGDFNEQ